MAGPSLIMDFLQHASNDVQGVVQGIVNPAAKLGNEVLSEGDFLSALGDAATSNQQGSVNAQQAGQSRLNAGGGLLHQGGILQGQETQQNGAVFANPENIVKTAGVGAEVGTNFIGAGAGGLAEKAGAAVAKSGASKFAMDFLQHGAVEAGAGAINAAGGELANGQSLNPEEIAKTALISGAIGGTKELVAPQVTAVRSAFSGKTPINEAGAATNIASQLFDSQALEKLAKIDNIKNIESQVEEKVGPVVAQKIAPAIATTSDPHTISNIIDNSLNQHVAPATSQGLTADIQSPTNDLVAPNGMGHTTTEPTNPSPAPTPLPPVTSVSDINTPTQVAEQGSAAEASYNPQSDEASLDQSAQTLTPKFLNEPGEASTNPSHISTLSAVSGMHDILNSGGTTDEAMAHYMANVPGTNIGEAKSALSDLIQKSGSGGSLDKSKINASLNPQYDKPDFPTVPSGSNDQAILNGRSATNNVVRNGNQALNAIDELNAHDLELVRYLRGHDPQDVLAKANDKEAFQNVIDSLKTYNDYTQAAGAKLGQDIPYRQQYGLRTPYNTPADEEGEPIPEGPSKANLPTNVSYTQGRYYNTHEEALDAGLTPRFANAREDLVNDISQRASDQSKLALAKGLEEAYPGKVANGIIPPGYEQLLIPGGRGLAMPSEIASEINTRALAAPAKGVLGAYDTINSTGKNLELGGGLFHGFNTAGIFAGQQLASGNLFKDPAAAGKVVANTLSSKVHDDYMHTIGQEGTFDDNHSVLNAADASGLAYAHTSGDIAAPEDKGIAGKLASLPVLKQVHQAIFERQIPTMMLEAFRQKTQGLDIFGNADDRDQAISIAKEINQNYGHLDRAIQGLTPKQFKLAGRVLLAADYQEGQIRTLLDAFNPKNIGTPAGRLARETVFGKALVFGGLATLGGLAGGDFKQESPKEVALAIMNKAIDPSFNIKGYKVGLPATQLSNVAKPIEESINGYRKNGNALQGGEDFANSHLAFLPSEAEQYAGNKNYAGEPLHGTDFYGRPITPTQTAEHIATGILPIPASEAVQAATGQETPTAAVANTAGLNARPQNSLEYAPVAGQTYIAELKATPGIPPERVNADAQFFEALGSVPGRSKVITQAEKDIAAKNVSKAQTDINAYNKKLVEALRPWAQSGGTQYLDATLLEQLRSSMIQFKSASSNVNYVKRTNPTSIGVPIAALANVPQTKGTTT